MKKTVFVFAILAAVALFGCTQSGATSDGKIVSPDLRAPLNVTRSLILSYENATCEISWIKFTNGRDVLKFRNLTSEQMPVFAVWNSTGKYAYRYAASWNSIVFSNCEKDLFGQVTCDARCSFSGILPKLCEADGRNVYPCSDFDFPLMLIPGANSSSLFDPDLPEKPELKKRPPEFMNIS